MKARRLKGPPESVGFVVLKLLCTMLVLAAVLAFYFAPIIWFVIAMQPPEWVALLLMLLWIGLSAFTYMTIKSSTDLGRFLCDWPRYY